MQTTLKHCCVLPLPGTLITLGGPVEYLVVRHSGKGFIARPLKVQGCDYEVSGKEFEVHAESNFRQVVAQ
jgi:hypothetical protein